MSVAIITGASRGLGLALATGLADAGWNLVLTARGAQALDEAVRLLPAGSAVAVPGDVTDAWHREAVLTAADELGGVDLLVNNAGILGPSPLPPVADLPIDALRAVYEVNVLAPLALAQAALPTLRARGGALVNISSDAAVVPYEGWGGYGSGKAALDLLSGVLAVEEPGVRVWWVDPGDLRTRMHQEAYPGEDISDRPEPASVVPAFLKLLGDRPASGRVRLA
ncbi:oxidoreductase [Longispora fulva]|uniref:NAD(P)-dependent dehydrogenase (Short-subunit alcohol dehydrogenase family) n=1 Tax=Longispora fulva TaxID=619741 RepID=A0A8J7KY19_9ACTN|nr:SDR family oxidoreductase [Longispora fulva]MBG6138647.1 NAD(P)-dependent dehydrogenase (short-subunit alcohol dehydrogenase family) [Longispora fulva]GIG62246.1 oxidoreductase [Longispora fulva]